MPSLTPVQISQARHLQNLIANEQRRTQQLRGLERQIRTREHVLSGSGRFGEGPVGPGGAPLMEHLKKILPKKYLPGNAGQLSNLQWPNFLPIPRFDLGTDPILNPGFNPAPQGVEVGQEAAFIVMAIAWFAWSEDTAGQKAPLSVTIRSRQSSRQFNDNPIPIQLIGDHSRPLILPVPLPVQPMNYIDVYLSTWLQAPMQLTGSGKHEFVLFGQRVKDGSEWDFLKSYLRG